MQWPVGQAPSSRQCLHDVCLDGGGCRSWLVPADGKTCSQVTGADISIPKSLQAKANV